MLRREREDIERVSRDKERVLKAAADARAAELMADFEKQIATIYSFDQNENWTVAYQLGEEAVKQANKSIAAECKKLGIPPEFTPSLLFYWNGRGQNSCAERRTELRRVARASIEALTKKAKHSIALNFSEFRIHLVSESLQSDEAKAFLESMPTADELMPKLVLQDIEQSTKHRGMLQ